MERMFRGYREERGCCSVNGRTDESDAESAGPVAGGRLEPVKADEAWLNGQVSQD